MFVYSLAIPSHPSHSHILLSSPYIKLLLGVIYRVKQSGKILATI